LDKGRCEEGNRANFLVWLEQHIKNDEFWVVDDDGEPASLMHFLPAENEIISVVTGDGKEGKGFAEALVRSVQERANYLTTIPISHGGRGLFRKCGFASCATHEPNWCWRREGGQCRE
jgi:hypothetical protein